MSSPQNPQRIRTKRHRRGIRRRYRSVAGDHGSSPSRMMPVRGLGRASTKAMGAPTAEGPVPRGSCGPPGIPVRCRRPGRADPGPWTTRCGRGDRPQGRCGAARVTPPGCFVVARTRPRPGCKPHATDPTAGIARRSGGSPSRRNGRQRSTRRRWRPCGRRRDGEAGLAGEDDHLVVLAGATRPRLMPSSTLVGLAKVCYRV
jgi:hypothetical protein